LRIWDVEPARLCRRHLLSEHRELHGLWNILTLDKVGYRRHPETQRWVGRLAALYARHEAQVVEMQRRGYTHRSPLDPQLATGSTQQTTLLDSLERQEQLLTAKNCECLLDV
jgi:hypothetical protein